MTPKERAERLILKYSPLVTTWDCYWDTPRNEDDVRADAVKCSLVMIEEIMEDCIKDISALHYWVSVKTELEALMQPCT
jgi:hypothetical protein